MCLNHPIHIPLVSNVYVHCNSDNDSSLLTLNDKHTWNVYRVAMFSALSKKISTIKRVQQVFHYAKSVRKSKEELREELESARFKVVRDALTSALKQKECLSVSEWKSLTAELNKNSLLTDRKLSVDRLIFSVLLTFRPPIDSLLNARSFIEARNLSYDLNVKTSIVKLYAKKHAEDKLTDNEEKELIELLVLSICYRKYI